jgi:UDP-galactopyranose mutase
VHCKYLIIGAGPTGLGAANRLLELGEDRFLVLEKSSRVGGLAGSVKDSAGFTWDMGGHVIFSHYEYFDALLDELLAGDYLEHKRQAMVRCLDAWVPYPFQNNIRHLPPEAQWECVRGLLPEEGAPTREPQHFRDWIYAIFGPGIAKYFMLPYNAKLWQTALDEMDFGWIGERVSVVAVERVLKNLILGRDDTGWGPNNTFRFPYFGGTGEIFRRLAKRVGDKVVIGSEIVRLNRTARTVKTTSGRDYSFEQALYTGPLDRLVINILEAAPDPLIRAAEDLAHSGAVITGVGLKGYRPDDTCWMYFPEQAFPFYRVTNFHNYSPKNVPSRDKYRAFMAETAFPGGGAPPEDAWGKTFQGLLDAGLISEYDSERVADKFETVLDYAYPVPTLSRNAALRTIQPFLEESGIYSRGRFGGWKYEVGNMDHSLMQGVEWAERMVLGQEETTYTVEAL